MSNSSLLAIVDRVVGTERAYEFEAVTGCSDEDLRAFLLRELHDEVPDAARAGMNEHALPGLKLAVFE